MLDYYTIAGLDWSRVHFPKAAPCPHGLMGAPYCINCLNPILEEAARTQAAEASEADLARARSEGASDAQRQADRDAPSAFLGPDPTE